MENDPNVSLQEPALVRHNAVSWIQQALNQGHTLGRALALASQLDWGGRHYSPRSLEGWFYEYRAAGFAALVRQRRSDKGQVRAFSPEAVQAIIKLRLAQPALPVTALIRQLLTRGVLEPGIRQLPDRAFTGCCAARAWIARACWPKPTARPRRSSASCPICSG